MFKYPKKPDGSPVAPSPFAENDVPDEWASPVQQPMASAPVDAGYFGAEESTSSPFEMGAAAMAPTTTRNVLNYDVSVVGILRFTDDLLVLDFCMPEIPLFAKGYRLFLHHVLPRIAGLVTGNTDAYAYLGDSIEAFPRGAQFCELMKRCGYVDPACLPLCMGIDSIYTAEVP